MARRPVSLLVLALIAGCASAPPPPASTSAPALLSPDSGPAPVVAALDARGLLGVWSVGRVNEPIPHLLRSALWDARHVRVNDERHRPRVGTAVAEAGLGPLVRPRRLAVALRVTPIGLFVDLADRDTSRRACYVLRPGGPRASADLELVTVVTEPLCPSALARGAALVARTPGTRPILDAVVTELDAAAGEWDRPGLITWPGPMEPVTFDSLPQPPTLARADVAVAVGAAGEPEWEPPDHDRTLDVHVAVALDDPPRLLVYELAPRLGRFTLRVVRAVGADLELERVP